MNDQRLPWSDPEALMPEVSGRTDVYLILGDPVEQVLAPETFNPLFARFGHDAVLVPVQVPPQHLAAFVRAVFLAPSIKGLWITIPHKAAMTGLLDHCSAQGRWAGAVNAVRRRADGSLEGALFDGAGLVHALDHFRMPFAGRRVLIIGAGGAAAAIGVSLLEGERPVSELALFDPVRQRSLDTVERLRRLTPARVWAADAPDPAGFHLVINASPMGMHPGDPLPLEVSRLSPGAAVMDIVMKNQPTPLVQAARARGHNAQPGFEMLILQAHLYLAFFGMHEAAESVRRDASALRERIYPPGLRAEIARAGALAVPTL